MGSWYLSRVDTGLLVLALAALALEASVWYHDTYRCTPSPAFADSCSYTFPSWAFVVGGAVLLVLGFRLTVDSLVD